jgi:hypothetical protein
MASCCDGGRLGPSPAADAVKLAHHWLRAVDDAAIGVDLAAVCVFRDSNRGACPRYELAAREAGRLLAGTASAWCTAGPAKA